MYTCYDNRSGCSVTNWPFHFRYLYFNLENEIFLLVLTRVFTYVLLFLSVWSLLHSIYLFFTNKTPNCHHYTRHMCMGRMKKKRVVDCETKDQSLAGMAREKDHSIKNKKPTWTDRTPHMLLTKICWPLSNYITFARVMMVQVIRAITV